MSSWEDYRAAKNRIIHGSEYHEEVFCPHPRGKISKAYSTAKGMFCEVIDPQTGVIEYWSTIEPLSWYYDPRESG
ncbi:MAG: hypothetical protein LBP28_05735 [Coriobacteriales bacterium]|jgi:hypothetical protein|nr:hypothetical protein [Coriobacteriales bacterium]